MAENGDVELGFDLIGFVKIGIPAGASGIGEYDNAVTE